MIVKLAYKSLLNRKGSALLTLFAIVVSVSLLIVVEHLRNETRNGFGRSVSGVDLIVGARTGPLNLLLNSVFHIGSGSNGMSWDAYQQIKRSNNVEWSIPIVLGDSHRGAPVIGTTNEYFTHYKYADKKPITLLQGTPFNSDFDVVVGADVAKNNGYKVGDQIMLSHGTGKVSFTQHRQHPFTISGVMNVTGTPLDKAVLVPIHSMEALHQSSSISRSQGHSAHDDHAEHEGEAHEPTVTISAVFLGLSSKIAILQSQRQINTNKKEALSAIIPGVALGELWQLLGYVEKVLLVISALVLFSSLLGLATMLLASLAERKRELAVLRAIGAGPLLIFVLLQAEALLLAVMGCMLGCLLVWTSLTLGHDWLSETYGVFVSSNVFTQETLWVLVFVLLATCLVSVIPAVKAYKNALASGLTSY